MKKNLLLIAVISGFLLAGCKYDDGPGISLRSKRDRLANEWVVTKYKCGFGELDQIPDSAFTLSNDSLVHVFTLTRSGSVNINIAYKDPSKTLPANLASTYKNTLFDGVRGMSFYRLFGGTGSAKWTFINKHKMVEFYPELSENYDYSRTVLRLTIIELRQEKLHLKGFDPQGRAVDIEFEAYDKK